MPTTVSLKLAREIPTEGYCYDLLSHTILHQEWCKNRKEKLLWMILSCSLCVTAMHSTHKASENKPAHYYSAGIFYDHLQAPRNRYLEAQSTFPPPCCSVKSLLYYIYVHGCMHNCCMHQSATESITTSTEFNHNEMRLTFPVPCPQI